MSEPEPARIPHAPPLRFARTVHTQPDGSSLVEAMVEAGTPAAAGSWVRPAYLVEIAAQAAAACRGSVGGPIRDGRLVGVSDWRTLAPARVDATIHVRVRNEASFGALSAFGVELEQDGQPLASGRLQVHAPPD